MFCMDFPMFSPSMCMLSLIMCHNIHFCCVHMMHLLQLLLERKSNEVGKLIKETEEKITSLTENISQTKVNSSQRSPIFWKLAHKTSETAMEWKLWSRRIKLSCTYSITVAIIHNLSIKNVLSLHFQLKLVINLCAANNRVLIVCICIFFSRGKWKSVLVLCVSN